MLTRNDCTVPRPLDVCREIRDTGVRFVGVKDVGLTPALLPELTAEIHLSGRGAVLELVSLDRNAEIDWANAAVESGVDYLLGGTHADVVGEAVAGSRTRYLPFAGPVSGRPTRLEGTASEIVASALRLVNVRGVYGIDLLAYRAAGDGAELTRAVVRAVKVPVIAAGGVNSDQRIRSLVAGGVWGFTVGTALFDGTYAPEARSLPERIARILAVSGAAAGAVEAG
jgi:uncharacterized protein related to proFAR isomerase